MQPFRLALSVHHLTRSENNNQRQVCIVQPCYAIPNIKHLSNQILQNFLLKLVLSFLCPELFFKLFTQTCIQYHSEHHFHTLPQQALSGSYALLCNINTCISLLNRHNPRDTCIVVINIKVSVSVIAVHKFIIFATTTGSHLCLAQAMEHPIPLINSQIHVTKIFLANITHLGHNI